MCTLGKARKEYERLSALDKTFYTCQDVSTVLECDQYDIHLQAHADASKLGFPVVIHGRRVKIPRAAFLDYIRRNVLSDPDIQDEE